MADVRRRLDDPPVEITLSLCTGYAAHAPAERLGVSGVLAAVTVGIYVGWRAPRIATANQRLLGYPVWEVLVFLLNATLFILVGLQLPSILEALAGRPRLPLLGLAALISLIVIGVRLGWALLGGSRHPVTRPTPRPAPPPRGLARAHRGRLGRHARRRLARRRPRSPAELPRARPHRLPHLRGDLRDARAPGPDLPALISRLGVRDDGAEEREELRARLEAAGAALLQLERLAEESWTREDTVERMRGLYSYRLRRFEARAGTAADDDGYEDRSAAYQRMVHAVIEAQRDASCACATRGSSPTT